MTIDHSVAISESYGEIPESTRPHGWIVSILDCRENPLWSDV